MKKSNQRRRLRGASEPVRSVESLENRTLLAATPSPVITAIDTSVTAGQAVFVHGLSSSLGSGNADTAKFEWDFGDSTGAYNKLVGYSAGHIYSKPGTYNLTLKLWNQDNGYKSTTTQITVSAASRKTIYVSAAGNDGNSGLSTSSPIRSVAKAAAMVKGQENIDLLFRDGDTFGTTSKIEIGGKNVRIASYGSGAKPVIRWDGARGTYDIISTLGSATGAIIEDITLDSKYVGPDSSYSGMPVAIMDRSPQLAIRNVTFLNVGYAVQTNSGPTGLLMQDNQAPTTYAMRSYLAWCEGRDFVFLGNKVANSTHEHPIRVAGVDRMLLAYNDLKNPQAYSWETSKTAANIQVGNYIYFWENTIRGPRWQIGPLGGADGVNNKSARLNHVVLDSNAIFDTTVEVNHGANDIFIRNNVFKFSNTNAIMVQPFSPEYNRGVNRLTITNNAFVNTGARGRVLYVEGKASGISLTNNLYQADSMFVGSYGTAAVYVDDTSLNSFTTINNNTWPVPSVSSYFTARISGGAPFNFVGTDVNNLNSYYVLSRWNALPQVGTDILKDISINVDTWTPSTPATPPATDGGSTPSTGTTPNVSALQIVDASTGKVLVDNITGSRSIALSSLATKYVRVQAITNSATSSVKLEALGSTVTDNAAPYQSAAKTIAAGAYAVNLTAYSADNLAGTKGNTLGLTLTFTTSTTTTPTPTPTPPSSTAPSVTKVQIIDLAKNRVLVDNIVGSTSVDLSKLSTRNVAFKVITANAKSVKLTAFGKTITENSAPFNSASSTVSAGNYAISMTPYAGTSLSGSAGSTFSATISFTNGAASTPPGKVSGNTGSGNTGSGSTPSVPTSGARVVRVELFNMMTNKVIRQILGDTTISLSSLPTTRGLAFRAVTENTRSVLATAFGKTIHENAAPFTTISGTISRGSYTVTMTPYAGTISAGNPGATFRATVKFV